MKEDVKKFVEWYNRKMDWNLDIVKYLGNNFVPCWTKDIIDEYLTTAKITEEEFDLENARIYSYLPDGEAELQAFNNRTCHDHYFWVKPGDNSETEYKKRVINAVNKELAKRLGELEEKKVALMNEENELIKIRDGLFKFVTTDVPDRKTT